MQPRKIAWRQAVECYLAGVRKRHNRYSALTVLLSFVLCCVGFDLVQAGNLGLAQDVVHIKARVEAFIYENDEFDAGDTWV